MTLDEAIEIKARTGEEFLNTDPDKLEEADRLSIEAMKRLRDHRNGFPLPAELLLPGETEK